MEKIIPMMLRCPSLLSLCAITLPLSSFVAMVGLEANTIVGFAETPLNITKHASRMETAVFHCHHWRSNKITWRVNGSSVSQFPGITARSNNLTIPARLEYNGTRVTCLAFFSNGSHEETPPATLTVIAATLEPKALPTDHVLGFEEIPSPPILILAVGETYTYRCNHSQTDRISWRVNGSGLGTEIIPQSITNSSISFSDGRRVSTLTIEGVPEYNDTMIQCKAAFSNGSDPVMSWMVTFLIQDPLHQVSNIHRNTTNLLWDAPFSLNLTNADPDIVYCVEVYNITCGRSLLINECDVMETSYTNDTLLPGYIYEYTVTPRSNVEGASNGTSANVTEIFWMWRLSSRGHELSIMTNTENTQQPIHVLATIYLNRKDAQESHIFLDSYVISLNALDKEKDKETDIEPTIFAVNESSMILQLPLPYRRLWNYTILAHGCKYHPITEMTTLSTHDIQNISVSSHLPGQIGVSGHFIQGSDATGILVAIFTTSKTLYLHLIKRSSDELQIVGYIKGVMGGQHQVSPYIMDLFGLPFTRTATTPKMVLVMNNTIHPFFPIKYELHPASESTNVCVTCTFLDSSTTGCVAVVHQQLSSSGLVNIKSSHRFNRSGDTAYGCILGVNLDQYQVGVVDGKMITPIKESNDKPLLTAGAIVGTGTVVLVIVVAALTVMILILWCKRLRAKQKRAALKSSYMFSEDNSHSGTVALDIENGSASYVVPREERVERAAEVQPLLTPPKQDTAAKLMAHHTSTPPLAESAQLTEEECESPASLLDPSVPPRQEAATIMAVEHKSTQPVPVPAAHDSHEIFIQRQESGGSPADIGTSSDPTCVEQQLSRSDTAAEKIIIDDDIQDKQVQHYALTKLESTAEEVPDDSHPDEYRPQTSAEIQSEPLASTKPTSEQECSTVQEAVLDSIKSEPSSPIKKQCEPEMTMDESGIANSPGQSVTSPMLGPNASSTPFNTDHKQAKRSRIYDLSSIPEKRDLFSDDDIDISTTEINPSPVFVDENTNPQQQSIFADSAIGASIIEQDTEGYEDGLIDQPTAATN